MSFSLELKTVTMAELRTRGRTAVLFNPCDTPRVTVQLILEAAGDTSELSLLTFNVTVP